MRQVVFDLETVPPQEAIVGEVSEELRRALFNIRAGLQHVGNHFKS
ncbi:hypothetical protein [Bradyrhizobium sp.]